MSELLNKISSYNFINHLFPGTIFMFILYKLNIYNITSEDIFFKFFICYFVGLIISRFGSSMLESLLKKIKFIDFADYDEFIEASRKDPKIEILSETNNVYRTIASMFFLLLLVILLKYIENIFPKLINYNVIILSIFCCVIFILEYRKQTNFIVKRVAFNNKEKN